MTRYEISQSPVFAKLIRFARERAVRGAELAVAGRVQAIGEGTYLVASSDGGAYTVDLKAGTCNCPDGRAPRNEDGAKFCKHTCAAILS